MRLPDFLIIGAMKAGTTTLYYDLLANPALFLPSIKEPRALVDDRVLTPHGRRDYARLFRPARLDQRCGEASTDYTKLPDFPGVPARAVRLLGSHLRAIYLVREPVARIISHHRHAYIHGRIQLPIDQAVRELPMFLNWSRYAMQIQPWLDALGPDQVRIVRFDDYVADRRGTVADLCRFLGVEPVVDRVEPDRVYNPAQELRRTVGLPGRLRNTFLYMRLIRPLLPDPVRRRLRDAVLPRGTPPPAAPAPHTIDWILEQLRDDVDQLGRLLSRPGPAWNLDDIRARYRSRTGAATPLAASQTDQALAS